MLNKLKKSNERGFTIIEVMIVLAIAGLILLIVFLAVPALQRSSRNTQRKSESSDILASINSFVANNNGTLPTSANFTTAIQDAKLSYYTTSNVLYGDNTNIPVTATNGGASSATALTGNDVIFEPATRCVANTSASGSIATKSGATNRSFTVIYAVEGASSAIPQCIGS